MQKTENNMKTRISFTVIALMMATFMLAGASEVNARKVSFASSLENEMDPVMKIENWMVNSNFWSAHHSMAISREFDEALSLESWMTDVNEWGIATMIPMDKDDSLVLEAWMTSPLAWNGSNAFTVKAEEPRLSLESWMTNDIIWNQPESR